MQSQTPTIVKVGDVDYPIATLAQDSALRLIRWVENNIPGPMERIRPLLDGLGSKDRRRLVRQAEAEARIWLTSGWSETMSGLIDRPDFQVEMIWESLRLHNPETPRESAETLRRGMSRDSALSRRVWSIVFAVPQR